MGVGKEGGSSLVEAEVWKKASEEKAERRRPAGGRKRRRLEEEGREEKREFRYILLTYTIESVLVEHRLVQL